jgi:hypothetical protein
VFQTTLILFSELWIMPSIARPIYNFFCKNLPCFIFHMYLNYFLIFSCTSWSLFSHTSEKRTVKYFGEGCGHNLVVEHFHSMQKGLLYNPWHLHTNTHTINMLQEKDRINFNLRPTLLTFDSCPYFQYQLMMLSDFFEFGHLTINFGKFIRKNFKIIIQRKFAIFF